MADRKQHAERFRQAFDQITTTDRLIQWMPDDPQPAGDLGPTAIFAREHARMQDFRAWRAIDDAEDECESPIEKLMLWALLCELRWQSYGITIETDPPHYLDDPIYPERAVLQPQAQIGKWRIDFLLILTGMASNFEPITIAIECDGHDYHERTKEQASRDKRKDRELQKRGVIVARYTGSDIWRDVFSCAGDVMDLAEAEFERMRNGLAPA